jgi:hypothetical protein
MLLHAIMIVENVQRPPWFRALERLKGHVFPRGTYGILQAEADRPLTDQESIDVCASTRLKGVIVPLIVPTSPGASATFDYQKVVAVASDYNPDAGYATDVASVYSMLYYELSLGG